MTRRIVFDGLNLSLLRGTGIATYTRTLTAIAHDLGYEVGVVYTAPHAPAKNALLREIGFFDERGAVSIPRWRRNLGFVADQVRSYTGVKPVPVAFSDLVLKRQFESRLPVQDHVYVSRNLFANARRHFLRTNDFVELEFEQAPDILHCTYQLPLRAKQARNIYTIHDLVPLRLPYTTLDNKRQMFRLLRKIATSADHIVTVSESSRRDIVSLLGVPESRVTNTYQAVSFPPALLARPESEVAEQLDGAFGLEPRDYLLFFGALEPKKNVARLIEAYLASGVDIPLVLVTGEGWQNDAENRLIAEQKEREKAKEKEVRPSRRRIYRFEYVSFPMLTTLIRGARAVVFPSLYEGFGLPVLEAMLLGTPVVTSTESSLPEVAGDAAVLVDPYDTASIAQGMRRIVEDDDLWAELAARGRAQAAKFSPERYRERIGALYAGLG